MGGRLAVAGFSTFRPAVAAGSVRAGNSCSLRVDSTQAQGWITTTVTANGGHL
jgi:hypothetical protein